MVQMRKVRNLIAEIHGGVRAGEIVVIGAHYDTVYDCPGADDNTSGVAALLDLPVYSKTRILLAQSGLWFSSMKSLHGSRRRTWAAWSMRSRHIS
jgi:Iap family predicted aminopeptidase